MNLKVRLLQSQEEFDQLRDEWDTLTERSAYPNIFTTWDWQSVWWKWFGTELHGKLWVLTVHRVSEITAASELIGIVPFYRTDRLLPLFYGKKHLRLIGYGGRTCPEYLGPIIRQDCIDDVTEAVINFLKAQPNEWDSVFFEDYAVDDPGTVQLVKRLRETFTDHSGSGETRLTITFSGDYDAYMATLSYNSRRQRRKRFNQAQTRFDARIEYPAAEELDKIFPVLVDLTTQARTRHGEQNPFNESVYAGFHWELLGILVPKNRAVLALLILNEKPAAVWYCFLLGKKCYAYQQGFSPEFEGSPSDVCQQFLIKRLTSEQYEEFDYLRGHETYKDSCTNGIRETEWCFVFRKRGIAYWSRILLDCAARPIYRKVKQFFKQHFQRSVEKTQMAESEPQPSEPRTLVSDP